jgi:predicted DCC family thiol-disulfide oxidoreductase YuxK
MRDTDNWLLYDGECPFCSSYVKLVRLREAVGPLRLINAREGGPEHDIALREGFDLDEGMLLHLSGRYYHGADCVNALAMLSDDSGLFGRFNGWVFRSRARSVALYPVLRVGRNTVIRLLGRRKLNA